ncbi:MAG: class I SAM-dependent methyltransferase [Chloroflexota bacterium]
MTNKALPPAFYAIEREAEQLGFLLSSEPLTGRLLRTLAASKHAARFLEIGTGAGMGTCWILDGMDAKSTLVTIERDERVSAVARKYLGGDPRATFLSADAEPFLTQIHDVGFDFIFADTFPGKFYLLEETLGLLNPGGLYIIDDLLPQPTWEAEHPANVDRLIDELEERSDLQTLKLSWASGLMVCTKK